MTNRADGITSDTGDEAIYRRLFDSHPQPMWVYDLDTLQFLAVNDAAIENYGYTRDEFLGMTIRDIRPEEDVPALLDTIQSITDGHHASGVWRHRRKSGEVITVEITSHTTDWQGQRAELVMARDVTEQHRTNHVLSERIKELQCLYRALELTTADDRTTAEILTDIATLLPRSVLHENDAVARIVVDEGEFLSGPWPDTTATLKSPVMVTGDEGGFVEVAYASAWPDEPDGVGPFLREERLLIDAVALHIGRMIGDRRMSEVLSQSEKLRSIGELTGGIAHDFNNLLTVILGNTDLLADALGENPDLQAMARTARMAAERGADLSSRLLAFARRQALDPKTVDVNALIVGMDALLRRTLGEHIEIQLTETSDVWPSLIDASQLENAILNLCLNARDAMPAGGLLTIETSNTHMDEEYASHNPDVTPGPYTAIAISDTGVGMHPEIVARAFDPFFTTKDVGKGNGLGLSMVYGFIKQSRGHIKIYSEEGLGTTVKLYLPRATETAAQDIAPEPEAVGHEGGSEKILVVEDDDLVRGHVTMQLESLGYDVVDARNGKDALDILKTTDDFDLLFTDVIMPGGVNGRQLADEAAKLHPDLPVLFTSGYTENAIVHHGRLDPGVHLLHKPYRRQDLAAKLRHVLDAKD